MQVFGTEVCSWFCLSIHVCAECSFKVLSTSRLHCGWVDVSCKDFLCINSSTCVGWSYLITGMDMLCSHCVVPMYEYCQLVHCIPKSISGLIIRIHHEVDNLGTEPSSHLFSTWCVLLLLNSFLCYFPVVCTYMSASTRVCTCAHACTHRCECGCVCQCYLWWGWWCDGGHGGYGDGDIGSDGMEYADEI